MAHFRTVNEGARKGSWEEKPFPSFPARSLFPARARRLVTKLCWLHSPGTLTQIKVLTLSSWPRQGNWRNRSVLCSADFTEQNLIIYILRWNINKRIFIKRCLCFNTRLTPLNTLLAFSLSGTLDWRGSHEVWPASWSEDSGRDRWGKTLRFLFFS